MPVEVVERFKLLLLHVKLLHGERKRNEINSILKNAKIREQWYPRAHLTHPQCETRPTYPRQSREVVREQVAELHKHAFCARVGSVDLNFERSHSIVGMQLKRKSVVGFRA